MLLKLLLHLHFASADDVLGEIFELKAELNNEKKEKRKEAVKKVIAAMTVGKDVRYELWELSHRAEIALWSASFH